MSEDALQKAVAYIKGKLGDFQPKTALVLGSGLGDLAAEVTDPIAIPYGEISGFPEPTVVGHSGNLIAGYLAGKPVILQSGRFHLYEGHDPSVVVLPIRVFAELGVSHFVVTNAAGGINRNMAPPTMMLITDHINLMWKSPLRGEVFEGEPRFPDMSAPYDPELRAIAREVALDLGIQVGEGVYLGVLGPSFETPAEIRMFDTMGADAVGMSTVPETIVANARGIKVLGISSITNPAAGTTNEPLNHEEVLEAGKEIAKDLGRLIGGVLTRIG
jgi:purine-nucleoside phosphorylase